MRPGGRSVSNFTTLSSLTLAAVGAVSLALGVMMWIASHRAAEPRLRWVAAGFGVMFAKSVFIVLTIHTLGLDHEKVQSADALFDLVALLLVASPFFMRSRP
jgi:hypothetical protein